MQYVPYVTDGGGMLSMALGPVRVFFPQSYVRIGAAMVDPVRAGHTWGIIWPRRCEACFWLNNATQRNGPTVWTATATATAGPGGGGR